MDDEAVDLRRAITPLRMIFWGGLMVLIDLTFNTRIGREHYKIDILDDFIGMLLISIGVFRLAALDQGPGFSGAMQFVKVVSVISTFKQLIKHWHFDGGEVWSWGWSLYAFVELAAILLFCRSMQVLCWQHSLDEPARSWGTTRTFYLALCVLPLGALYGFFIVMRLNGKVSNWDIGAAALVFLAILLLPWIHFFVSTSRMKRAVEAQG